MEITTLPRVPLVHQEENLSLIGVHFIKVPRPAEAPPGGAIYRNQEQLTCKGRNVTLILEYNPEPIQIPVDKKKVAIIQIGWMGRIAIDEIIVYPQDPIPIGVCYTPAEMFAHLCDILADEQNISTLYQNAIAYQEL